MAQSATNDGITKEEYYTEISGLADEIEEFQDDWSDISEGVLEIVDSHQWIIYTKYHLDILQHSAEEPDEWKHLVADGDSWRDVIQALAFDAMRNDVWAEIHDRDTEF